MQEVILIYSPFQQCFDQGALLSLNSRLEDMTFELCWNHCFCKDEMQVHQGKAGVLDWHVKDWNPNTSLWDRKCGKFPRSFPPNFLTKLGPVSGWQEWLDITRAKLEKKVSLFAWTISERQICGRTDFFFFFWVERWQISWLFQTVICIFDIRLPDNIGGSLQVGDFFAKWLQLLGLEKAGNWNLELHYASQASRHYLC